MVLTRMACVRDKQKKNARRGRGGARGGGGGGGGSWALVGGSAAAIWICQSLSCSGEPAVCGRSETGGGGDGVGLCCAPLTRVRIYICMYACMHAFVYVHIHMFVCMHACAPLTRVWHPVPLPNNICASMHVYVSLYIHILAP